MLNLKSIFVNPVTYFECSISNCFILHVYFIVPQVFYKRVSITMLALCWDKMPSIILIIILANYWMPLSGFLINACIEVECINSKYP